MKINTKIRYGLRMLLMLAETDDIINTAELGKKMQVSPKYLRKLAGPLEKKNLIKSVQGIYGGYALNKDPKDISLLMLFEAYDERINLSDCVNGKKCRLFDTCVAQSLWRNLQEKLEDEFFNISLQNVLKSHYKQR